MFQIRYPLITSLALLFSACNHENEPTPASSADADARAPSASDSVPPDTAKNFDDNTGGINRAGDVPGPLGGGGLGGLGGGVGRSANDGKDAPPSTIGSSP
jgi:hypothetical protein